MTTEPADYSVQPEDQEWLRHQVEALTFGDVIKSHRLCEEWTQTETAQKLGIPKQLLSAYERGLKLPSISKACQMASVLGMVPEMAIILVVNDQLRSENLPFQISLERVS